MRIGIDIDDTITDSWEYLKPIYAKEFNLTIDYLNTCSPYYRSVSHLMTKDEYLKKARIINDKAISQIPIKKDASKYIKKLHNDGHKIIFITARGYIENASPYEDSAKYLNKFDIYFDKLIVNCTDKSIACKEENIDILIDDNVTKIEKVKNIGIKTILFDTSYNKEYNDTVRVSSWEEVYDCIKRM